MKDKPSMIDDLLDLASLPDATERVSLVETHISLVFVADDFVYKVKKPVNFGFLDFTALEKRRHYCFQEVRLNQRLAEDVYMGVLPITHDGRRYRVGEGEGAERSPEIDEFGRPEAFRVNTDENFEQTERYKGTTIEERNFYALREWTDSFYEENSGLFRKRIRAGKIRDCHGDLHMEHICLTEKLSIIDCIEFNDRFRYSDILADIAFLRMDLEYQGGKGFADQLWKFYGRQAGEAGMEVLLAFYKVYRAYVRGKVTSFQLDDDQIGPREKEAAAQTAARYFQLARSYI